jgi:hypothetical protein
MQRDMESWPVLGRWGDLRDCRIVSMVHVYAPSVTAPSIVALLLQRQTPTGPHRWHILHRQGVGFYASEAGWNDADGRSLLRRRQPSTIDSQLSTLSPRGTEAA